jgi:hypothetical protein
MTLFSGLVILPLLMLQSLLKQVRFFLRYDLECRQVDLKAYLHRHSGIPSGINLSVVVMVASYRGDSKAKPLIAL